MARWNLKVNYNTVREVAESAKLLAGGVDGIKNEIKNVQNAVSNCSGAAITALEEKTPELDTNLDKLKDGLNKLGDVFNEFADSMLGIIAYGDAGVDSVVHINTNQVKSKLKTLINKTEDFANYATSVDPTVSGNMYSSFVEMSDTDKANLASVNSKLDNIQEMMAEVGNYIAQFEDDFEKMRTKVIDYENMDDDMKAKIQDLYEELADIQWWQTTTFKVIVGATLIVAAVAVIVFVPAAAVGAAGFALGVAKGVVAYGALNATIGVIGAYYSGDDIEEAAATGLFEGTIEGLLVGGAAQTGKVIGTAFSKTAYGQNMIANSKNLTNKSMVKSFEYAVEYGGQVANTTFKKAYNGQDIDMGKIMKDEALKHGWKAVDKISMSKMNTFFAGKTKEIIGRSDDIADMGKMGADLLKLDGLKKVSQYTTKAGIYFGQTASQVYAKEGNMEISDFYNEVSNKYDGVKLLKYVIKDDFKNIIKDQVSNLSLHPN